MRPTEQPSSTPADTIMGHPPNPGDTSPVSEKHLVDPAPVPGFATVHAALGKTSRDGAGDDRSLENCQSEGDPNAPSYGVEGSKPTMMCEHHRQGTMKRIQHQDICSHEGCDRETEVGPMSRPGEVDLFCSDHHNPAIIVTRTEHCQFFGCGKTPKYGQRQGLLSFCQLHKRAGMYTNRNGQLLVATRDGSAYKEADGAAAVGGAETMGHIAAKEGTHFNTPTDHTTTVNPKDQGSDQAGLPISVEADSLGRDGSQRTTASSLVTIIVATSQSRKVCEVTGCRIQPSYGPSGTSRPRFCAGHKKKGMVGLKNRPCTFPGCSTRPHYGLPGCRPIYCAKHKTATMVHILKETTSRDKGEVSRDFAVTSCSPSESGRPEPKRRLLVTRSKQETLRRKVSKKGIGAAVELDGNCSENESPTPLQHQQQENKKITKEGGIVGERTAADPVSLASSSSRANPGFGSLRGAHTSMPVPGETLIEMRDPGTSPSASAAQSPLPGHTTNSRLAESLDMKPSVEIQVLNETRELARVAAEASGSGRRARVPSRKALEASGKLRNEGIQWLTKEKKVEDALRMKELKAQRKAAAAAGLKAGEVIETVTMGAIGGTDSGRDGSGTGMDAALLPPNMKWRKLSPSEILEAAKKGPITNVVAKPPNDERGTVASGARGTANTKCGDSTAGMSGKNKHKPVVSEFQCMFGANTTKANTSRSQVSRKQSGPRGVHGQAKLALNRGLTSRRSRYTAGVDIVGVMESGEFGSVSVCQFEDCSRKATFGVNGNVRYCELHPLFGMHRISNPKWTP